MARPHTHPILTRALTDIVVGSELAKRKRAALDALGLRELELQYQYAISGAADTLPAFASIDIPFDFPLHFAPGQRDSDLENPQMKFGCEVSADVMVTGHVFSWDLDSSTEARIGATVKVGVLAPLRTQFTGVAHFTFQGFGSLDEVNPEE